MNISAIIEPDEIFLVRLQAAVPGCGIGSQALSHLKRIARRMRKPIHLFAVADHPCWQRRLDRFYRRHGFQRRSDSIGHPVMVWEPK